MCTHSATRHGRNKNQLYTTHKIDCQTLIEKHLHKTNKMDQQLEEGLYDDYKDHHHPPSHHTSWMCVLAIGIITVIGLIQYSAIVLVDDE